MCTASDPEYGVTTKMGFISICCDKGSAASERKSIMYMHRYHYQYFVDERHVKRK